MITKLLGLASIGGTLINVSMLQRFLAGIAGIIALTVLSALSASILMAFGLYGIYEGLIHTGMEPDAALIMVAAIVFFFTVCLGGLAWYRLQQLREMPTNIIRHDMPVLAKAHSVVNAFLDGLMAENPPLRD